jgi:hypothetical protein
MKVFLGLGVCAFGDACIVLLLIFIDFRDSFKAQTERQQNCLSTNHVCLPLLVAVCEAHEDVTDHAVCDDQKGSDQVVRDLA